MRRKKKDAGTQTAEATADGFFPEVVDAVSRALVTAVRSTDRLEEAVGEIVGGVIRGALEVGRELRVASRGAMVGVLRDPEAADITPMRLVRVASAAAAVAAAESGGDLTESSGGLVEGAIDALEDRGIEATFAASAVAQGLLDVSDRLGVRETQSAYEELRRVCRQRSGGTR